MGEKRWLRIVVSLFPESCVRTMAAKNHFNEIN